VGSSVELTADGRWFVSVSIAKAILCGVKLEAGLPAGTFTEVSIAKAILCGVKLIFFDVETLDFFQVSIAKAILCGVKHTADLKAAEWEASFNR